MEKPIVFISHITEEAELAKELKQLLEESFLGMLEIFVSSDEGSLSAGTRWLDDITHSLSNCKVELILCSEKSIKRPWINFEAGAGWVRQIPVIPLCHSGMEPSKLPIPLNMLQAAKLSEVSSLKLVLPVLAEAINSKTPNIDFTEFIEKVKLFEEKYVFWDKCNDYFNKLEGILPGIKNAIIKNQNIRTELPEYSIVEINKLMDSFFIPNNILNFKRTGNVAMTSQGTFYSCEILLTAKTKAIVSDVRFKY